MHDATKKQIQKLLKEKNGDIHDVFKQLSIDGLNVSIRAMKMITTNMFKCLRCNESFDNLNDLQDHVNKSNHKLGQRRYRKKIEGLYNYYKHSLPMKLQSTLDTMFTRVRGRTPKPPVKPNMRELERFKFDCNKRNACAKWTILEGLFHMKMKDPSDLSKELRSHKFPQFTPILNDTFFSIRVMKVFLEKFKR